MDIKLRTDAAWDRITHLAALKRRGPSLVAVPYLGRGASKRLPLRAGDLLVTRFDDAAFKGGLVDPNEVVKYINRGVEVHAVANLHAKVFVFGRRALVGSTNVSDHSAERLIEAVCECNVPSLVLAATRFVKSLRGDLVELDYARGKIGLYRPPKFANSLHNVGKGRRSTPMHSSLAAVMLSVISYDEADENVEQEGSVDAQRKIQDPGKFSIASFRWTGKCPAGLRRGIRILRCTKIGKSKIKVEPPARIRLIRKYRSARGERAMIFVEERKWARERPLTEVIRQIPGAALLRRVKSFRQIRDAETAVKIGQLWTSSR